MTQHAETHQNGAGELELRTPLLARQLREMYSILDERFAERGTELSEELQWAMDFTEQFLLIRLDRAEDLRRGEFTQAREMSLRFIGEGTGHFVLTCMDGRLPLAVPMSHVPHVGGVMRTAAGDFEVFRQGSRPGTVIVDDESYKAKSVERILQRYGTIHYSFDSHIGCAARGGSEKTAGSITKDAGLMEDIRRKMLLARGIEQIRARLLTRTDRVAELFTQFISYDPHDGSLTMGLEMYADNVARNVLSPGLQKQIARDGLSEDVRGQLSAEGKIVNTWQFLRDQDIVTELRQVVQPSDFRNRFSESMLANWQAITALYQDGEGMVFRRILDSLYQAYERGGWNIGHEHDFGTRTISHLALINKAKVMLKNLVTRWSIAEDKHDEPGHTGHHIWPFAEHLEQGLVFTEGGFGPFRSLDMFAIYSRGSILNHANLAVDIVRGSRAKGAIKDPLGRLEGEDFIHAPVPVMNKAIVREMSESGWKAAERLNLRDVFSNIDWDSDDVLWRWDKEHTNQLLDIAFDQLDISMKPRDVRVLQNGVYETFDRMRQMMRDHRFRPMLLKGQVVVTHMLVDRDRRTRIIIPMVPHVSLQREPITVAS